MNVCERCGVVHPPLISKRAAARHAGIGWTRFDAALKNGNGPAVWHASGVWPRFSVVALDEWLKTPTQKRDAA